MCVCVYAYAYDANVITIAIHTVRVHMIEFAHMLLYVRFRFLFSSSLDENGTFLLYPLLALMTKICGCIEHHHIIAGVS